MHFAGLPQGAWLMPDFMVSPFDRPITRTIPQPANDVESAREDIALPASGRKAMIRGARGRCPRCNEAKLFVRFLKPMRSEEHTSELQSLMRISYAVFCLKKKNKRITPRTSPNTNE